MKAIDIIDAMTFDADLAESSSLWKFFVDDVVDQWVRRLFGSFHLKSGTILPGYYLTMWQCDSYGLQFVSSNQPDAILARDFPEDGDPDDQEVYLWRVDE